MMVQILKEYNNKDKSKDFHNPIKTIRIIFSKKSPLPLIETFTSKEWN